MKPIGILGGGQLARMLVLEAHRLNIPVAVLSPSESDPARSVSGSWHQGDPNDAKDLVPFMSLCSSVTFESEFYNAEKIEASSQKTGVPVWPRPRTMALLQDRLTQKKLFDDGDLPTSMWRPVDSGEDALVAYVALGQKVVFKKRRGGYDGYGTFIVKNETALSDFIEKMGQDSFIAEKFVPFKREIAVIAVRDQKGSVFFFPFVETHQKDSRCLWVQGPLKENSKTEKIKKSIARFLKSIDYVGAIGIELFDTGKEWIVNETAPRVHNSGHYTMDAFDLDQFALHLRAVANLPLRGFAIPQTKAFAMWNLIGDKPSTHLTPWLMGPTSSEETVHWYGKQDSRAGRKMGHVTTTAKTTKLALSQARKLAALARKKIGY